ncbi:hypothetical protein [Bacillus sp. T33-2]|uniref:hypothetical protein n=1 Tax=Bacillus sp. T33-2 TaxID=2054168 RepID=UPI000C77C185|nr:hypothetical protein [Bacillus sp. T33-2]PLR98916.1 hypothetical protein CVD19_04620 [Bacillus sp. T33-2]
MFDPTAFENMKVVVEGAVYDRDLSGEIVVTGRNDWINTATMSRRYEIYFALPNSSLTACLKLDAGLLNLAAELMAPKVSGDDAGCTVTIRFFMEHQNKQYVYDQIQQTLEKIWGSERNIEQTVKINPLSETELVHNEAVLPFNRLIVEEQIDDLAEMVGYMIISLNSLQKVVH